MTPALRALEAELRRLDAAATPGPWTTLPPDKDCPDWFIIRRPGRVSDGKFYVLRMGPDDDGPDARLIATLRNALPALLDALATAREGAEALRVLARDIALRLLKDREYVMALAVQHHFDLDDAEAFRSNAIVNELIGRMKKLGVGPPAIDPTPSVQP